MSVKLFASALAFLVLTSAGCSTNKYEVLERIPKEVPNFEAIGVHTAVDYILLHDRKLCLIVMVARTCGPVGVKLADGRYSYPVRHETGITRESRLDIATRKTHFKSDSHEFFGALKQFVRDAA